MYYLYFISYHIWDLLVKEIQVSTHTPRTQKSTIYFFLKSTFTNNNLVAFPSMYIRKIQEDRNMPLNKHSHCIIL